MPKCHKLPLPPRPDKQYRVENPHVVRTYDEIAEEMLRRHGIRMTRERVRQLLDSAHAKIERKFQRLERVEAI